MCRSRERVETHPFSLSRAAITGLRKLDVANAGGEVPCHRLVGYDMAQEMLPADAVWIFVLSGIRDLIPVGAVIGANVIRDVKVCGVERLFRCLRPAPVQAGKRRAFAAVD